MSRTAFFNVIISVFVAATLRTEGIYLHQFRLGGYTLDAFQFKFISESFDFFARCRAMPN